MPRIVFACCLFMIVKTAAVPISCHSLKWTFLPQLKLDILAAIKKYVQISDEQVQVNVSQQNDTSMMEVSVSLDPKYDGTAPTGVHERYSTDEDINSIKPITEEEQA